MTNFMEFQLFTSSSTYSTLPFHVFAPQKKETILSPAAQGSQRKTKFLRTKDQILEGVSFLGLLCDSCGLCERDIFSLHIFFNLQSAFRISQWICRLCDPCGLCERKLYFFVFFFGIVKSTIQLYGSSTCCQPGRHRRCLLRLLPPRYNCPILI